MCLCARASRRAGIAGSNDTLPLVLNQRTALLADPSVLFVLFSTQIEYLHELFPYTQWIMLYALNNEMNLTHDYLKVNIYIYIYIHR